MSTQGRAPILLKTHGPHQSLLLTRVHGNHLNYSLAPWACECVTCGIVMLPRLKLEGGGPTGWGQDVSWLSFPRPLALQACEPEKITATYQGSVPLSVKWMQKLPPSLKYGL